MWIDGWMDGRTMSFSVATVKIKIQMNDMSERQAWTKQKDNI